MAFKLLPRTRELTDTVGTGAINLTGAAASNVNTFGSQMSEGDTTYACVLSSDSTTWEEGFYTLTSGDLARTAIIANSAGDTSPVSITGGQVFGVIPHDLIGAIAKLLNPTTGDVITYDGATFVAQAPSSGSARFHDACELATTGALAANTYNNGASGVGATLTANANGAIANIDGIAVLAGYRILVKDEATASHNGIYVVTQVGDGSNPYILTRAADFDELANIGEGDPISVGAAGVVNALTLWQFYTAGAITIGTTDLNFARIGIRGSQGLDLTISATPGSIPVRGSTAWGALGPGTAGQVVTMVSGVPAWATPSTGASPAGSTNALQYNAGSGSFGGIGPLTNGQLLIGSTGSVASAGTITAGAGISITNGAGSVTVAATGGSAAGLFAPSIHVPTVASSGLTSWTNQGGATVSDTDAGVMLTCAFSFTNSLHFIRKAAPATPYRIKALISLHSPLPTQYQSFSFGWADGSGASPKLQVAKLQFQNAYPSPVFLVVRQSDPNTYVSSDYTGGSSFPNPIWIMIRDDGTNIWFYWSADGRNFQTHSYSVAKASGYLGSSGYSNIIFGIDPNNQNTTATLHSYEETA